MLRDKAALDVLLLSGDELEQRLPHALLLSTPYLCDECHLLAPKGRK
ncbi:hypothetical protein [Vibrio fluminensis]|nr:hypothetical protein [Vibrio fluminensis]